MGLVHNYNVGCFSQKHLLPEAWIDLTDNVEKELLYFQVLYTLRADKFPVTQMEAVSIIIYSDVKNIMLTNKTQLFLTIYIV